MSTQANVFTAAQADALDLTYTIRRALVRSGVLRELRQGIFTTREQWESEDDRGRHRIVLAGALLIRGWQPRVTPYRYVGGLRSAAFLLDLPFQPDAALVEALNREDRRRLSPEAKAIEAEIARIRRGEGPWRVDLISSDRCRRTYRNGVNVRPATSPPEHLVLNQGVPITSMARTAVDLMRDGRPVDAVIAADGALHLGVEHCDLERVGRFCSSWSNGQQALDAIAFADGRAESAAESLARYTCAQHVEIPTPELQVELYDGRGLIGRVDLFFRKFRVVLEVDGYIKYTDPWCGDPEEALRRQHEREARLRTAGWTVVRTTWEELTTDPAGFIRRLLAAFAEAA